MSVGFCGTPIYYKETFAMSVGFCGTPNILKETFAMFVGFFGSLNNNFSMSVGFCGPPYVLKRNICNVFGVLWDSNILKRIICNVCGVLWDSIYTKKKHLQCLWCSVGLNILKRFTYTQIVSLPVIRLEPMTLPLSSHFIFNLI